MAAKRSVLMMQAETVNNRTHPMTTWSATHMTASRIRWYCIVQSPAGTTAGNISIYFFLPDNQIEKYFLQ